MQESERLALLQALQDEKEQLLESQQRMSVTHYTQRAKNQYMNFVERVNKIDESIKVMDRKKFVMKD